MGGGGSVSKEAWLEEYERLWNEREDSDPERNKGAGGPKETDEQLAERAQEAYVDRQADLIDWYRDLRKDGEI
jgi:hypothetical protein